MEFQRHRGVRVHGMVRGEDANHLGLDWAPLSNGSLGRPRVLLATTPRAEYEKASSARELRKRNVRGR